MTALTTTDGTTFTINLPTNSSVSTSTIGTTTSTVGVCISNSGGGQLGTYGPCIHGAYGQCSICYSSAGQAIGQYCTCSTYGSVCPIHSLQNTPLSPSLCTCGQYNSIGCPVHLAGTITPSWVTWPPSPPSVDLHSKEGHRVSHEMVTDEKGLKIVFKCSFCNEVIYKKYIVRIPRKAREEKCLVRILNHK